ncbi:hypothetical protein ACYF6T_26100 [Streptomyces sp. 7R007]
MNGVHDEEVDRPLTRPVLLELSAGQGDFAKLEEALAGIEAPGVSLHESDPAGLALLTAGWQTIVVSVVSAGGLKMVRDVLIAHISGKQVKINITRSGTEQSVTFEGRLQDSREVEQLVRDITAEQPSE